MSDTTLLIEFTYNCQDNLVCFNSNNIHKLKKCLRKGSISKALSSWKKYNLKINSKKKEISKKTLDVYLSNLGIEYNFIGNYLLNLKYETCNYIIDFINDSIEICNFIDSFDNSKLKLGKAKAKRVEYSSKYSVNETEIEDDSSEESDNLINRIDKINKSMPTDLQSLIKFSIENSDVLKPIIKLLNSKTDNMFGDIIDKVGLDLNTNKISSDDEILKISKYLKLIEDLNNTDITNLSNNDFEKFNFIISEIWNQIKRIITSLNSLSPSDNYESMLHKYQALLKNIGYNDTKNKNIQEEIIQNVISETLSKILKVYYTLMESKYLELNIILQGVKPNEKSNKLIDSKISNVMSYNNSLYQKYFSNIFNKEEITNIFSNYNKEINFRQVLNNLNNDSKNYLVLRLNNEELETIDLDLDIKEVSNFNKINFNLFIDNEDVIESYYLKYQNILKSYVKNKDEFVKKINNIYNQTIFLTKKKELSLLLVKFHEEIKFKLSIINKIIK